MIGLVQPTRPMKTFVKFLDISYRILLVTLFIVAGLAALSAFGMPGSYKLFVVQTGSMQPAIKTGSLVVIKPFDKYENGEVISYKVQPTADIKNPKAVITHRVYEVSQEKGITYYTTKGDANETPDFNKVAKDSVLGKVILNIPLLGYPVGFAKTQTGFVLLIVIPATIIVYSELMNIKNEAKKLIAERRKRKLTPKEKLEVKIGKEEIAAEKGIKKFFKKIAAKFSK